jgi:RNA polymerase sigma-70 factor (ECF subfamily)
MNRPAATLMNITRLGQAGGDSTVTHADVAAQLEELHPQCLRWAMTCCGNREDAEDVLHDTYVGVLDHGLRFNGASSFRTWIFGVIRNKARALARRERLRAWLGIVNAARVDGPAAAALPDADAIAADRRWRTRRALDALPARQREVLLLVFYHDLTVEQAAEVMRVSVGSARTHYARGKARMAVLLAESRP